MLFSDVFFLYYARSTAIVLEIAVIKNNVGFIFSWDLSSNLSEYLNKYSRNFKALKSELYDTHLNVFDIFLVVLI